MTKPARLALAGSLTTGASVVSGLSDLLDLPAKFGRSYPALEPVADVLSAGVAYWPVPLLLGLGVLLVSKRHRSDAPEPSPAGTGSADWRAPDQAAMRASHPAYPALISLQPRLMGDTPTDVARRSNISEQALLEMALQETTWPRKDVIDRLCVALFLPKDACSVTGALATGRLRDENLMRAQLAHIARRFPSLVLGADGLNQRASVQRARLRGKELEDIYKAVMAKRTEDADVGGGWPKL